MRWILLLPASRRQSGLIYARILIRKQFRLQSRCVLRRTLTIHMRLSLWWITFPLKSVIRQIRSFCSRSSGCCVRIRVSGYLRCWCCLYRDRIYWHEKIYRWVMCSDRCYRWPRDRSEARNLSWREFDRLMSGIDTEQPKAIKAASGQCWKLHSKNTVFPLFSALFRLCIPVNQSDFPVK